MTIRIDYGKTAENNKIHRKWQSEKKTEPVQQISINSFSAVIQRIVIFFVFWKGMEY